MRQIMFLSSRALRGIALRTRGTRIPWVRRWVFHTYYARNTWGDNESRSGGGSSFEQTETIRRELPRAFERLSIASLLDVPCGDGHWWRCVSHTLDHYIGADVVPEIIEGRRTNMRPGENYLCLDVATDTLPEADAILCRDLFVHFSNALIFKTLQQFTTCGARYLITTTFPGRANIDIETGSWRPIDLTAPPFEFPTPLWLINENCTEAGGRFADKSLGVWRTADLQSR